MPRIHKFFLLSPLERSVFLRALWLLAYFRLSLRFRSLKNVFQDIEQRSIELVSLPPTIALQRIIRLLCTAARLVPCSTCFSKSLAGFVLIRESGYSGRIHIGVINDSGKGFSAHAWLTSSGDIVLCNLPDIARYREIPLQQYEMFGQLLRLGGSPAENISFGRFSEAIRKEWEKWKIPDGRRQRIKKPLSI